MDLASRLCLYRWMKRVASAPNLQKRQTSQITSAYKLMETKIRISNGFNQASNNPHSIMATVIRLSSQMARQLSNSRMGIISTLQSRDLSAASAVQQQAPENQRWIWNSNLSVVRHIWTRGNLPPPQQVTLGKMEMLTLSNSAPGLSFKSASGSMMTLWNSALRPTVSETKTQRSALACIWLKMS